MRYILKLTAFALLGLLLVSCSKSSSGSKHNASIKLQGVLEKGKAIDALCEIKTLDGKAYSKSNKITQGGYVASVPAGAFDVRCTISKYIDDKTGETRTPTPSIVLEAISFAKTGKNKTVNVNVITDLVAKELIKSKGKIKDEKSFDNAKEDAKNTALKGILSALGQSTIKDIDTLHLDRTQGNTLTKVSLAIQEQIDNPNSHITTVSRALRAAKDADSIANQDVNDLSLDAIATPPNNIQSSKPIGQTQAITLTGATIGGVDVTTKPTNIDITKEVVFSIPTKNLGQVADSDSVYITSNKSGTTPKKLEGGKTAPYTAVDVRDLFKPDETTFTICVIPTITTLDSTASVKCHNADRKATFTATVTSSTGVATETVTTITLTGATIGGKAVTLSPTGINSKVIAFSLPANDLVDVADSDSVYITSNKSDTTPKKLEGGKTAPYTAVDVRDLFKPDETTFTICVIPTITTLDSTANEQCKSASVKKTFTATAVSTSSIKAFDRFTDEIFVAGYNILGDSNSIDGSGAVTFSMPKTIVTKLPTESVYITSDKARTTALALTRGIVSIVTPLKTTIKVDGYNHADISSLLLPAGKVTTLYICILPTTDTPDSALCKNSPTQKNLSVVVMGANSGFDKSKFSEITIGGTHLKPKSKEGTLIDNTDKIIFSIPKTLVTISPDEAVYITDNNGKSPTPKKLKLVVDHYEADIKALFSSGVKSNLLLCILPKDMPSAFERCISSSTLTQILVNLNI